MGVVLVLIVGSVLLYTQLFSGPTDIGAGPGMLYFYAEWCHVCQGMEPVVDGLEGDYGREFDIVRLNIDTSRGKKLAREHGFIGQPTFILFGNSGEEVRRLMGPQDREVLAREIEQILGK